jgi:Chloramphenicol acetyltransferase
MATYLDTSTWARRDAFEFFRGFDKPFFNVCVRLDVARLKTALAAWPQAGLSLACYFIALRLANRHMAFRLRLEQGRVRVHDEVHGSTTVLRDDGESFFFADLQYTPDFTAFVARRPDRLPVLHLAAVAALQQLQPCAAVVTGGPARRLDPAPGVRPRRCARSAPVAADVDRGEPRLDGRRARRTLRAGVRGGAGRARVAARRAGLSPRSSAGVRPAP